MELGETRLIAFVQELGETRLIAFVQEFGVKQSSYLALKSRFCTSRLLQTAVNLNPMIDAEDKPLLYYILCVACFFAGVSVWAHLHSWWLIENNH